MSSATFNWDFAFALVRATTCAFGALLFAQAAWSKLRDLAVFRGVLSAYRLLPPPLVAPMAVLLPAGEAGVAILLLIPPTQFAGASLAAVLMMGFASAIALNVTRGRITIDCGCGGRRGRQHLSFRLACRNLVLATLFALCAHAQTTVMDVGGALIAVAAGASLFLLYASYETLAAESKRPIQRISPTLRRLAWSRPPGGIS